MGALIQVCPTFFVSSLNFSYHLSCSNREVKAWPITHKKLLIFRQGLDVLACGDKNATRLAEGNIFVPQEMSIHLPPLGLALALQGTRSGIVHFRCNARPVRDYKERLASLRMYSCLRSTRVEPSGRDAPLRVSDESRI